MENLEFSNLLPYLFRLDVPDDNNSDEVITENNNTKSGNDTAGKNEYMCAFWLCCVE